MRKTTIKLACVLALGASSVQVSAVEQQTANWPKYDNNRIAISFDGNSVADKDPEAQWATGDKDDWSATVASCAIIAKLGLQDNLVHCSYNNFIGAPQAADGSSQCKTSLEGAFDYWNFDKELLMDVTADSVAAEQHFADQIMLSTAEDPLFFIHAGLAEFVYQAVNMVIEAGKAETLNHLYLVSHSGFNETHLRRSYHHTWADVQALAKANGAEIGYTKIKDQNATWDANTLWSSLQDYSVWYWLRDHADPSLNWMYSRMQTVGFADLSDGGMLYWLLVGDDSGSPSKFEAFLGNGVVEEFEPTPDAPKEPFVGNSIVIEAEDPTTTTGSWQVIEDAKAGEGKSMQYTGPDRFTAAQADIPKDHTNTYEFEVTSAGTYTVRMFVRQAEGEETTDQSNDIWIDFPDAQKMASGSTADGYLKFYQRQSVKDRNYIYGGIAEGSFGHSWLSVKFETAGTYTLSVGGRSKGFDIDRFILYNGAQDAYVQEYYEGGSTGSGSTGGTTTPEVGDKVYTYPSAEFEKYTGWDDGFVDAEIDPWRKVLSIADALKWGAAETAYTGKDGKVKIKLTTMLEVDGESEYKVYVGGKLVGEKTNDCIYLEDGTAVDDMPNYIKDETVFPDSVDIKEGDIIRVEFKSATNGKIPEPLPSDPEFTATSRGRWVSVEVLTTEVDETVGAIKEGVLNFEEETTSWQLWSDGPYSLTDNTDAADIEARGNHSLYVLGSNAKSEWTNVNIGNNYAVTNGYKIFPNKTFVLRYDVKVVTPGVKTNFELRLPADATNQWGVTCGSASDFIPHEATDGWETKEATVTINSSVISDAAGHALSNFLLINDFTTAANPDAVNAEFYLDNLYFIVDGVGGPSTGIQDATANKFEVTAEAGNIIVKSDAAQTINIYTIAGQLVSSTAVEAGEEATVATGLAQGVYVVNNTKVVVK